MVDKTHPDDAKALKELYAHIRKEHPFPYSWIANHLGLHRQGVRQWSAVPIRFVAQLEKLTGIPRDKLSPHSLKKYQEAINAE